ncbi:O-antigen ligase family protein [Rubrivirga marina]|uniref:O-antigen ligase family protein n=1 Tax=Rubrivirga marina TaxID=1196024 RepID=UPI000BA91450|nr:O-antigen ligase family protein [Rubrivirga marina]
MPSATALALPSAPARTGDRYLVGLGWLLLAYALLGRGAAYLGVPPVYVGELAMGIGLITAGARLSLAARTPLVQLLVVFMLWGAACTAPYLSTYGVAALRDAALWGYGCFAIVVAALLLEDPERLRDVILRYRRFVVVFGALAWLVLAIKGQGLALPRVPGTDIAIVEVKSGDTLVHVAGAAAFLLVGLGRPRLVLIALLAVTPLLANRAGMLSCAVGVGIAVALTPFASKPARLVYLGLVALVALALFQPTVTLGDRTVSGDIVVEKIESIVAPEDTGRLSNTREWRLEWWSKIVGYTVGGPYFWAGKGYGVNLSVDDGFMSAAGESLRSPHNSHMTVLARSGVPGFLLWAALHLGWLASMLVHYARSRRAGDRTWMAVFAFLIAYWTALMVNASFDVVLESPMGAIWMWTLFGTGVAAMVIHTQRPEVLTATD